MDAAADGRIGSTKSESDHVKMLLLKQSKKDGNNTSKFLILKSRPTAGPPNLHAIHLVCACVLLLRWINIFRPTL